jgi:acyl-coenzyme A thioesterase PaaI-like protein
VNVSDVWLPPRGAGNVALCGACRRSAVCRLGFTREWLEEDGSARFEATCLREHEGGPGVAHGGWITWAMDEAMGHLPLLRDTVAVTARLTVDFVAPVPVGEPLRIHVWDESIEGRKWTIAGVLEHEDGRVLARAHGLWIAQDPARYYRPLIERRDGRGGAGDAAL